MLRGFREFILKGNVVDLAVGVVVGVAFGNVVTAMVRDLITPLIGAFGGAPNFSEISFAVNNSKFLVGDFINSLISFLTIAAIIYFAIAMPMNKLMEKMKSNKYEASTEKTCPECLSLIPLKAKRCKYCTAIVE